MKYTNDNVILEECPMCKSILTSWSESQYGSWVCDCCGFGKSSTNEHKTLQKIIRYRENYFNNEFSSMENFEENYNQRENKK